MNPFPPIDKFVRLERLPSSGGISPLKSTPWKPPERPSISRAPRPISSRGISPFNSCPDPDPPICNQITRPLSSVLTPDHSPNGASLSQFPLSSQFGPSRAL